MLISKGNNRIARKIYRIEQDCDVQFNARDLTFVNLGPWPITVNGMLITDVPFYFNGQKGDVDTTTYKIQNVGSPELGWGVGSQNGSIIALYVIATYEV